MSDHDEEREDDERDATGYEWVDLFPIYDAPDELSAIHVRAMLLSAGIEARIRSAQVPWLDGVLANVVGYWGQVLVPRVDVITARALLSAFLADVEREGRAAGPLDDDGSREDDDGSREDDGGSLGDDASREGDEPREGREPRGRGER